MKSLFVALSLLGSAIAGAQNVGIGTTTPVFKLDVRVGSINTDSLYRIRSLPVLSIKGVGNLFAGENAGLSNTTGHSNTAAGQLALVSNTIGHFNVAIGNRALMSNTTGVNNTAVGTSALSNNETGENNTAVGIGALITNATGHANVGVGEGAVGNNTGGEGNAGLGYASLPNNQTGNYNVGAGTSSLSNNISGSYNTGLGFNTRTTTSALTNATAIGANAVVGADNSMVLGSIEGLNGASASTNVGIGTTSPASTLHVVSGNPDVAYFEGPASMYIPLFENGAYRGYIGSFAGNANDVDFGTGVGNPTGSVHLTLLGVPRFSIKSDNNATLYNNELHRTSTGNANLVPIAYGNVSSTGFVTAGSGNITVTHGPGVGFYQIAITGEAYQFQQYITVVTPIGTIAPAVACTGSGGGMLQVQIYTLAGADVDQNFHFVVYKP